MLLFKKRFWEALQQGRLTLTFRRWTRPHVRPGGRYRCLPIGVLVVDDARVVRADSITDAEARRAGFTSRGELMAHLEELGPIDPATSLYRIELRHDGDG